MLKLKDVSKTFHGKENIDAVKHVNLEIQEGEIFGLIGFSGAGKSTLIRMINLLERPSQGQVWIDGIELTALNEKELRKIRKKIGMIFQHFNLMRSRTIAQNIAYPLKRRTFWRKNDPEAWSKNEIQQKVAHLLKLVELEDKANAYPSELSGGQKQRVAIARALANDPKILLCDEATSALDPQTTQSILKLLKQVNQTLGITIVLITHEMGVIKEICDRVGVMEDGEIKELGNVVDVFADPKETITRNFIATTSNISKIYELVKQRSEITVLRPGERMVLLSYNTINTNQALISQISRDYEVDANIIFGNIEVLQNKPLGRLVVIFSGKEENIASAIERLKAKEVKVEEIETW